MAELGPAARSLLSLEHLLARPVLEERAGEIRSALAASRLVVVRDAVREAFADRVWRALDTAEGWKPYEGAERDFHYRHHNLLEPEAFPADLLECRSFFGSPPTVETVGGLSGRDCGGPLQFGASWYMPGDYSLPHTDGVEVDADDGSARRQVAFLWHLTRDWDDRWGGHLYWGPNQQMIRPAYNSLYLFSIDPGQQHFVAPVSGRAVGKRLTVNGWWTGAGSYPTAVGPSAQGPLVV